MSAQNFPLASNQQDIWFDQTAYAGSPLYNIGGYLRIDGEVDVSLLNSALLKLIEESDALRITLVKDSDQKSNRSDIFQVFSKPFPYTLKLLDFSAEKNPEENAQQWIADSFKIPFSLDGQSSLWQFSLLKIHSQCYFLMTQYHHLIADGWTTKIVISRLAELYNALLEHRTPANGPKYHFSDYLKDEKSYLDSEIYHRDESYWLELLSSVPIPLIEKTHHSENEPSLPAANLQRFFLPRSFYNQLELFSEQNKVTVYHLLLSAVALYFARIYDREEICIGVPSLNRKGARYKDVLGMFISLSPVRLATSLSESVDTLLKRCGEALRQNYRHQRFPLGKIYQRLGVLKSKRNSIFDIVVSYERQEYSTPFGTAEISAHQQFSGVARYPLGVTICEFHQQHDVEIVLEGAETSFSSQELEQLGQRLTLILSQMIANPRLLLKDIELLSVADKKILYEQFNRDKQITPYSESVINLFQQHVRQTPQSIALESNDGLLTFQQLDEQSNQLAHYLIALGAKREQIIAISLPRGKAMIIGLLAILKSGAAYLPIDPDTPDERIRTMLEQSQAKAFVSVQAYQKRFSQLHGNLVCLDKMHSEIENCTVQNTTVHSKANDLAYMIFTSGSSGKPKGVLLEHGCLARRLNGLVKLFDVQAGDRVGQTVHFNFDPSIIEIFLPLIQGGRLVLAPEHHQTPEDMAKFVVQNKINMLAMVPSGLRALLQGLSAYSASSLKTVCCGGEVLPADLAKQFIQQTGARLFNVYGPTETVILATAWECSVSDGEPLPIGRPINDSVIGVMDRQNNILPQGVKGEIAIGGIVARGYLHAGSLNQEKFFSKNGTRYYKTGDKGYIGLDGQLYFSGRFDRQIKISGYRIEPGEIENVLEEHPEVSLAAVTSFKEQKNIVLYAFVELENDLALNNWTSGQCLTELSALLRKSLPEYMQPRAIVPMTKIPILTSGKIDYSALLQTEINHPGHEHKLPRSPLETHLMQCWEEVLGTHDLGIRDDFFEFGGDSLSAIKLINQIESVAGHHVPLSFLLEYSTIEQQAEILGKELPSIAVPLLTTLSEHGSTPPFYLAASGHGDAIRFANLAEALGELCSLHMLQPSGSSIENKSIEELAMSYAELILIREEEPGYIGGFSIGGITALETARILSEQGKPPLGVLLLDTVYPHRLLKSSLLYSFLRFIASFPLLNKVTINGRRLETMLADPGIRTQLKALREYKLSPYDGDVALFVSSGLWGKCWCFPKWEQVCGHRLRRILISGMHGGIFQAPHLATLTKAIQDYFKA